MTHSPRTEWEGHDFSAGGVSDAYLVPDERWEHVFVSCEDKNVKLVLVLDLEHLEVGGHYLLDLNKMYGPRIGRGSFRYDQSHV